MTFKVSKLSSDEFNYLIKVWHESEASSPNTPKEILEKLSNDEDFYVRACVAQNSNSSEEVLEKLSNDEDFRVRAYVALNPNTSEEILKKLMDDGKYIYECVCSNTNLTETIRNIIRLKDLLR